MIYINDVKFQQPNCQNWQENSQESVPPNQNQYALPPQQSGITNASDSFSKPSTQPNIAQKEATAASLTSINDMLLKGTVNGTNVTILLDTGSSTSLITDQMFQKLQPKPALKTSNFDRVIAINESETKIKGCINVQLQIGEFFCMWDLNVLDKASYDVLLGRDFLQKYVCNMKMIEGIVEFVDLKGIVCAARPIPAEQASYEKEHLQSCPAKVAATVFIPPGEEAIIHVYPTGNILMPTLIFEGNKWLEEKGISAKIQEVAGIFGTMPITLKNESTVTRKVYSGRKIGTLTCKQNLPMVSAADVVVNPSYIVNHVLPKRHNKENDMQIFHNFVNGGKSTSSANIFVAGDAKSNIHELSVFAQENDHVSSTHDVMSDTSQSPPPPPVTPDVITRLVGSDGNLTPPLVVSDVIPYLSGNKNSPSPPPPN